MAEKISPIPPLNPNQEVVIHTTWYYDPNDVPVVFDLEAIADYGNSVEELDESNNNLVKEFTTYIEPKTDPLSAYIIVHAFNPESREIASLGYGVEVYNGDVYIGSADGVSLIPIPSGHHTINVKFNGMTLTQEVDLVGSETPVELTFNFSRTEFAFADFINGMGIDYSASIGGTLMVAYPDPFRAEDENNTSGAGVVRATLERYGFIGGPAYYGYSADIVAKATSTSMQLSGNVFGAVTPNGLEVRYSSYAQAGFSDAPVPCSVPSRSDFTAWYIQFKGIGDYPLMDIVDAAGNNVHGTIFGWSQRGGQGHLDTETLFNIEKQAIWGIEYVAYRLQFYNAVGFNTGDTDPKSFMYQGTVSGLHMSNVPFAPEDM